MFADPVKFKVVGNARVMAQKIGVFPQQGKGSLNIFKITFCGPFALPADRVFFNILKVKMRSICELN